MDANEMLRRIRELVREMQANAERDGDYNPNYVSDLCRAVMALDSHLTNGGTLPDAWERPWLATNARIRCSNTLTLADSPAEASETNAEGLTWEEWRNAASAFGAEPKPYWVTEWRNGVDPTEYANGGD